MPAALHRVGGSGSPVVLIHGFGSDRLGWVANSPALMEAHTVWAVELPAHGTALPGETTPAEMALAVADVLPQTDEKIALIGHSLGGAVAAHLAADHPDRIGKVALIAPAGYGGGMPDRAFLEAFSTLEDEESALALLQRLVVRKRLILPQMAQYVLAHLNKPGIREALAAVATEVASFEPAPLPAASLVVWGADDEINPLDQGRLSGLEPEALVLPDTGHLPHVEAATKVNRTTLAYLAD
ncbi:MAG: alpha/beta fold hydrolase [Pseudomonadota bacterium]